MAVSYNDKQLLSADATFQKRVRQAMIAACVSIKNEAVTTAFHRERETFLVQVINAPDTYMLLFTNSVSNDSAVINSATATGTVALTTGNVATQAALVTDASLDTAVASQFNSFFRTPAS